MKSKKPIVLSVIAVILVVGMLSGGVRTAHALSFGVDLDAASTSQTDTLRAATASNAHAFRIGAIVSNASTTNPISNVYGWQFQINYNASAFIPQGDPNSAGLYPDGAFNTVLFGAQTTTGTPNWAGLIAANQAFGSSTISTAGSNGQIQVFITLISPAPAQTISARNILANVAFELLPGHQAAAYTFTISNVIFVNSAGGGIAGPIPGLSVTETVTDNPPVAKIGGVTHLANGDPTSCVPVTGLACTAYAYSFDGSASTAPSGTIANPGGFFWDFGDGVQDLGVQGAVAVHDYGAVTTVPGKFNVTLRVADTALDTGSARDGLGNVILNVQPSHTQILNFLADQFPTASFTATPNSGPSPLTVNFNAAASSDPDGTIAKYFWNFGDGNFLTTCSGSLGCANVTTASHTYTASATASLIVQDNTGGNSTNTATAAITVTAGGTPPVVTVNNPTPNPANEGQTVTVTWTVSSGTTVTQSCINWGDGSSQCGLAGILTANHVYSVGTLAQRIFTITVNATNTAGTGSGTHTVTVNDLAPTVSITSVSPSPANEGATVTVTVSASDDEAISKTCVNFGDGSSSCTAPFTHVYSTGGVASKIFSITANATDAAGLSTTSSAVNLTVNDLAPTVSITSVSPSPANEGATVTVTVSASDDEAISKTCVNFGDGSSSCTAPFTHVYSTGGVASKVFSITANATDAAGLSTTSTAVNLTVNDLAPTVSITSVSPSPANEGATVTVTVSASDDEAISKTCVNFGDGSSSCTAPFTHVYSTGGLASKIFSITANATDAAGLSTTSTSVNLTVNDLAPVVSITSVSPSPANEGATVTVTVSASDDEAISKTCVNFGDGSSSCTAPFTHVYSTGGLASKIFSITANATDAAGLSTTSTAVNLTVNDLAPTVSITSVSPSPANEGATVTVTVSASDDEAISKTCVSFGDGSSSCTAPFTHVYSTGGVASKIFSITANATDAAGKSTTSTAVNLTVNDLAPTVSITSVSPSPATEGATVTVTVSASDDEAISKTCVNFGDGSSSCTAPFTHVYSTGGVASKIFSITANATDAAGLSTTSTAVNLTVNDLAPTVSITSVSPSPANEGATVTVTVSASDDEAISKTCVNFGDGSSSCTAPFTHVYSTGGVASKIFSITANATDAAGLSTTSTAVNLTVNDLAPTVSITSVSPSPANEGATVTVTVSASDDEAISKTCVNFGDGSSSCTAPFTHIYSTGGVASKIFTITANATDAAGKSTTSTAVNLTVNDLAPTVSITSVSPSPANEGATVTVTVSASDADEAISKTCVNFGDGSSSCIAPFTHIYSTGGVASKVFSITANATDAAGLSTTSTAVNLTVNDLAPTVSITSVSPSPANEGATVTVTVSASDDEAISKTCVNFGDGSSSCTAPFTHLYSTGGVASKVFSITANATDAAGLSTTSTAVNLTVNDLAPTVSITSVSPSPANEGATVTVTVSASDDEAISKTCVNFGDGSSSCTAPFTHVYSTGGAASKIFSITANATDAAGLSTTSTAVNLTVNDLAPVVSITSVSPSPANEGATVTVTVSASDDEAISKTCVSFGDGSSSCTAPFTHVYTTGGVASKVFSITANATDAAGKSTTSTAVNLTVNDLAPTVSITSVSPSPANEGATVTVTVSASDADEAISKTCVNFGDGSSSCTAPFTHVYSTGGVASKVFSITANATDAAGLSTTSTAVNLTVNDLAPTVSITSVSPSPANEGATVTVAVSASDDEAISKTCVNFGDGSSSCTAPFTHVYSTGGVASKVFSITANATDAAGLSTTSTAVNLTVNDLAPTVSITSVSPSPANEGATVTVTVSASDDEAISKTCVNFGDGSSSCTAPFTHVYSTGGVASKVFSITANATDAAGLSTTSTAVNLTVNDLAPTVSITSVSPSPASEGATVTVTVSASDDEAISKTCVSFGDGSSSCTAPFTHVYTTGGVASKVFSITANATDAAGKSTTSTAVNLTVNDLAPTVSITSVSPSPANEGATVTVTVSASDDEAISKTCVSFGDGSSSCTAPFTHVYSTGGVASKVFSITANATDAAGLSTTSTAVNLTVNDLAPTVSIISVSPSPANEGATVTVTVSASDDEVISKTCVNFGDGSSSCTAPFTHVYSTGGVASKIFSITANATDAAGLSTTSTAVNLTVNDLAPTVTITSVSPSPANEGQAVTVTVSASDDEAIAKTCVSFGDGSSSCTAPFTHVYSTGGVASKIFSITANATDAAGLSTTSTAVNLTVNDLAPTVSITSVSPSPASEGATVTVTVSASDDEAISKTCVNFGDGSSSCTAPFTHIYSTGGVASKIFSITANATDAAGKSTTSTAVNLTVNDLAPTVSITSVSPSPANEGATVTVTVSASDDEAISKTCVNFGDGSSSCTAPFTHVYSTGGVASKIFSITANATDAAGLSTTSTAVNLTVNDLAPTISITSVSPSPANEGATVTVTVSASDDEAISKTCVNFGDGSSSCTAPFTHVYSTGGVASKIFSITANATDAAGLSTTSTAVNLTVNDLAPTVSITSVSPSPANEGATVTVTVSASDDEAISKTCVNFGDGSSSCTAPFTHVYSTGGVASKIFSITANATDAAGKSTTSAAVNLTVNDLAPTVNITSVTPNPAAVGATVTVSFTASDDEAISKTCVNFGDGSSVCGASPQMHSYSVKGSFVITVNATDAAGLTSSATASETIGNVPVVTITSLPASGNEGATVTVTFTVNSTPGAVTSLTVNWGDGTAIDNLPVSATSDTHVYHLGGTVASQIFTVIVSATNSTGTGSASRPITINDLAPTVSITSVSPSPANEGATVTVTVSASDADEAISKTCVNFGDGSSSCAAPFTHIYSTGGVASKIFSITANATDAAGLSTTSTAVNLTVNDLAPSVSITSVSPSPANEGATVTVTVSASDDEAISKTCVNFGDGSSSCSAPFTHVYSTGGVASKVFSITANATDAAGLSTTSTAVNLTVNDLAPTVTITSVSPSPANEGATVTVTVSASDDEAISKTCVNFGDGSSSCTAPFTHVYSTGGAASKVFSITANATDAAGLSTTSTAVNLTVNDLAPTVSITSVSPSPATEGATVTVTVSASDDEAISKTCVNFGDGSSSCTAPFTHVYSTGGVASKIFSITANATDAAGLSTTSTAVNLTVNDLAPTVSITSVSPSPANEGATVTVTVSASDDEAISKTCVNFGDGSSSCTAPFTHVYSTGGAASKVFSITANATDAAGLSTTSTAVNLTVNDLAPTVSITSVSPSPANEGATVTVTVSASDDEAISKTCVNFGDGSSSCTAPFTHVYSTGGVASKIFSITANATDAAGLSTTSTAVNLTVNDLAPTVSITSVSPSPANEGATVTVTVSASDDEAISKTCVSFGDGSSSCAAPFTHVYSTGGAASKIFSITANSTDAAGKSTTSTAVNLTVNDLAPTVSITSVSPSPANEGATVTVTVSASDDEAISKTCVNFGDGSSSCTAPFTHVYSTGGAASKIFSITANATDAAGLSTTSTAVNLTVNDLAPTVTITSVSPSPATSGQTVSVSFTATDDEAISSTCISWGDGASACGITSPVTHVYSVGTSTVFTIKVNATDAAGLTGSASASETVTPPGAPVVTVNTPSPPTANEGQTVTVTWTVSSGSTVTQSCISWGDGASQCGLAGITTANHIYNVGTAASKLFTITVNATNSGGTGSGSNSVTVNDLAPTVSITSVSPSPANEGATVTVTVSASDDEAISKTCVNFGDGSSSCTAPFTHVYSTGGVASKIFSITANATDAAGKSTTSTAVNLTVNDLAPTVSITSVSPSPANEGATVTVTVSASDDEAISKTCVNFGDGSSSCAAPFTHVYSTGGVASKIFSITANATDAAGLSTTSTAVNLTVNDLAPTVSITSVSPSPANEGATVTVTVSASDDEAISKTCVNFGDGSSSCTAPFTHVYSTGGAASKVFSITANATDAAGLSTTSTAVNLTVNDLAPTVSITSVSPSPANEGATVTVTVSASDDEAISKTCVNFGDGSSSCSAPFTHVYSTGGVASKTFSITANATDAAGKSTTSTAVNLTVNDLAPTVSITSVSPSPASEGATVTVTVSASDDEAISKTCVNFGDGSSSCTSPFTHVYSTGGVASKIFSITANATDAAGLSTTSTAVNLTVNDLAPTVSITSVSPSPANEGATVTVTVSASDDEAISKTCVNFGDGSSSCTAPFTHVYSTGGAASKVFSITANATDAAGLSTTSTAVNLTVNDLAPTVTITSVSPNPATSGQTVSVSFTATDDEAISKTCISWGDGVSACGIISPVTHVYTVSVQTIFTIRVNATDAAGLTGSASASETVNPVGVSPPVVTVNAPTPNPANEGQTVTVTWTVSSSATVTQSCISWGDGSSACGLAGITTANHVYNVGSAASRVFMIVVNATNSGGTGSGSNSVTVNDLAPTVSITSVSPSPANEGQTVTVTVSASDDEAISKTCVNFGDGSSSCTAPFTHIYSTGGSASKVFSITANATDAAGKTGSASATLTVNDLAPVVSITSVSPNPANEGASVSVSFTASDDEAVSNSCIAWGDGASACGITSPVTHVYSAGTSSSKIFNISVNATDAAGLTGSASASVTINDLTPVVTITGVSPNPATTGQMVTVSFTASDDEAISTACVNWGDGVSACGISSPVSHAYTSTGSMMTKAFTITINATDAAGRTGSASASVMVNDRPPVVTVNAPTPNPALTGQTVTVTFSATDPDGTIASFLVTWGDGSSTPLAGSATSATHSYANTGSALSQTFMITVTATDNSGSTGSANTSETVNDRPPVAVIASPSTAVVNTSVTFDGSGSTDPDGTVVAWAWDFGDSTTGSGAIVSHTYTATGTFTVTLTVTDNSGNTATTSTTIMIVQSAAGHASFNAYGAKAQFKKIKLSVHPTETLLANVVDDGTTNVTVYVEFKVLDGSGVGLTLFTQVVPLSPHQVVDGTSNPAFTATFVVPNTGTFTVTATLFTSSTQSTTIGDPSFVPTGTTTFSFFAF